METSNEFMSRFRSKQLPVLNSSCPGWICYAEKTHASIIPLISRVKSPQQLLGSLVKTRMKEASVHVTIMPCYDKKLEASRDQFQGNGVKDVDLVLTTVELEDLIQREGFSGFSDLPEDNLER